MRKKKAAKKVDQNKTTGLKKIGSLPTYNIKKTYRELKREAVIRGMPFPDVVAADVHRLISYIDHSDDKPNISLVDQFDDWVDNQLSIYGYEKGDPLRNTRLRLGFIGEELEDGTVKVKRIKGIPKPKKVKRERDESGLFKGTKKSYTFELATRGFTLERVQSRVLKKFPDAKIKSIKIWYGTCVRGLKNGKGK